MAGLTARGGLSGTAVLPSSSNEPPSWAGRPGTPAICTRPRPRRSSGTPTRRPGRSCNSSWSTVSPRRWSGSVPSALTGPRGRSPATDGGRHIDTNGYINASAAIVGSDNILVDAGTERLRRSNGRVTGADVTTTDGRSIAIEARSTLLATGGLQGDPGLVAQHIDRQGRTMPLRSNPISKGDGLRLATAVGADIGPSGAMFYGHLVPSGIALGDPSGFAALSQYYSDHALLFNIQGERFVDETRGDHVNAVYTVEQPEARALLVMDSRVREQWMLRPLVEGMQPQDSFGLAMKRGARAAVANDVHEFAFLPEEWGYPGERIRDRLGELNVALRAGATAAPGRTLTGNRWSIRPTT